MKSLLVALILVLTVSVGTWAQEPDMATPEPHPTQAQSDDQAPSPAKKGRKTDDTIEPGSKDNRLGLTTVRNIFHDQVALWSSPARIQFNDLDWLVPMAGLTAGMIVTDKEFSKHLSNSPTRLSHSNSFSNYGVAAFGGVAGGLYLWGLTSHDEHKREAGLLSAEAAADGLLFVTAVKYVTLRSRPNAATGAGDFWNGGDSFPSDHAVAAWSIASVVAHEYPGWPTKLLAYGLATAVSVSRVTAKEHFPSDVFVGSAAGWLIGDAVYHMHHDPALGGTGWSLLARKRDNAEVRKPSAMGSPYVPLDSWVYPAFERLAAMGYVSSSFFGMRPWTRLECARILSEATENQPSWFSDSGAGNSLEALEHEFERELSLLEGGDNRHAEVESVYAGILGISGQPLTDGYHFGQTIIDNFGRPYQEGVSTDLGGSAWATAGRWTVYVRGEFDSAPSGPILPASARAAIPAMDFWPDLLPPSFPVMPAAPTPSTAEGRLLDSYVGLTVSNWQFSFGPQSLDWGYGADNDAMMYSTNAAPIPMMRVSRVTPLPFPSILHYLGPMRMEIIFGQLSGHEFVFGPSGLIGQYGVQLNPQPYIDGTRIDFHPTSNLEYGLALTTIFGGPGVPLTFRTLRRSFFSTGNGYPGSAADPGDRRSGFDFSYRLPYLRNWLTFYGDGFAEDQPSPIAYSDRSAWRSGLYAPHLPGLSHLDLRVEGVYTDVPAGGMIGRGFFYYNLRYINGYTNDGNIIGSWVGRQGQGALASSTYWFGPRRSIQTTFRHLKVSQQFVPGGGSQTDISVYADWLIGKNLSLKSGVQYERWLFPVLAPGSQKDFSTSVGVTYWPTWTWK